jgi:hypothetical protein
VGEPDMVVRQVSRNLADVVGMASDDALSRPLLEVLYSVPLVRFSARPAPSTTLETATPCR